jgi:hypothetical protein
VYETGSLSCIMAELALLVSNIRVLLPVLVNSYEYLSQDKSFVVRIRNGHL